MFDSAKVFVEFVLVALGSKEWIPEDVFGWKDRLPLLALRYLPFRWTSTNDMGEKHNHIVWTSQT